MDFLSGCEKAGPLIQAPGTLWRYGSGSDCLPNQIRICNEEAWIESASVRVKCCLQFDKRLLTIADANDATLGEIAFGQDA